MPNRPGERARCLGLALLVELSCLPLRAEEPPALPDDAPRRLEGVKADCPECLGQGTVPCLPYKPRIVTAGEEPPKFEQPAAWKFCSRCVPLRPAEETVLLEARWRDGARVRDAEWAEITGAKLQLVTTPFVSIHAALPARDTQRIAKVLEQLAAHLQETTRSTLLTPTRPDRDELILVAEDKAFNRLIDAFAKKYPKGEWELTRKGSGGVEWHYGFSHTGRIGWGVPNHALFMFGQMAMHEATNDKARPWLIEGFGAYCENAIMHGNYFYSFSYEANETRLGSNWDQEMRKWLQKGQLKDWEVLFTSSLIGLKAVDYASYYSVVSYLLKTDGPRFAKMVQAVRDGQESAPAIEAAYGKKLAALQADWKAWVIRLGAPAP
jgi:hypothetical protein